MTLKSYFSPTVESAMAQAARELGPDAMLIYSREAPPEARSHGRYEVVFGWECEPGPGFEAARGAEASEPNQRAQSPEGNSFDEFRPDGWAERLANADFSPEFIARVSVGKPGNKAHEGGAGFLRATLEARIPIARTPDGRGPKAVVVVGAPGVGKTSMIAKLAFHVGLARRRPVHLVNTDTNRLCGGQWLERFAALTGCGYSTVGSVGDAVAVAGRLSEEHLLLVDGSGWCLPGGSPADSGQLRPGLPEVEVHLMLAAAWRRQDLDCVFRKYSHWKPDRIVVARADESIKYGAICSIAAEHRIPISFVVAGESVAGGIEDAKLGRLVPPVLLDQVAAGPGGRV